MPYVSEYAELLKKPSEALVQLFIFSFFKATILFCVLFQTIFRKTVTVKEEGGKKRKNRKEKKKEKTTLQILEYFFSKACCHHHNREPHIGFNIFQKMF